MLDRIQNICAIGAGAMGAHTALCFSLAGYPVKIYDISEKGLKDGIANIESALDSFIEHKLITHQLKQDALDRITPTSDIAEAAKDADWVIESIVEVLDVKQKVFQTLDNLCPKHTIFSSNTSGLSPTAISENITRKDKFVITHFWNPPHLIPLVEIVPGANTSKETVDIAFAMMLKIGKKPVKLDKECLGFVGNRLQLALLREALYIVNSGIASAEAVDDVVKYSLGRRLAITGPIESADLGGLDIFKNIFSYLAKDLCNDTDIPQILSDTVATGHLGAKTGQGLYAWEDATLQALKEKRVDALFQHLSHDETEKKKQKLRQVS